MAPARPVPLNIQKAQSQTSEWCHCDRVHLLLWLKLVEHYWYRERELVGSAVLIDRMTGLEWYLAKFKDFLKEPVQRYHPAQKILWHWIGSEKQSFSLNCHSSFIMKHIFNFTISAWNFEYAKLHFMRHTNCRHGWRRSVPRFLQSWRTLDLKNYLSG